MVNRDQLIKYLFHEMAEDEREDFTERWFVDPETREELRMTEAELLDAYARGRLPAEQRKRIERWLLGGSTQRQKLDFAQALTIALPSAGRRKINWAVLGAVAAGLVLLASLALLTARYRRLENELARLQSEAATLARSGARSGAQTLPGAAYAIFLPVDTLRSGGGVSFSLPKGVDVLHLEVGLEPGQERDFDSAVVSISGRAVWRQQPVNVESNTAAPRASLWIPARLLEPGNYTVRLESQGAPVAYYSFTMRR
jgi:hypothetical protein